LGGSLRFFYSTYIQTKNSFREDDNHIRLHNSLEGDAFKMVKPLFISGKNLNAVTKTLPTIVVQSARVNFKYYSKED
jgi:hypothetical protein